MVHLTGWIGLVAAVAMTFARMAQAFGLYQQTSKTTNQKKNVLYSLSRTTEEDEEEEEENCNTLNSPTSCSDNHSSSSRYFENDASRRQWNSPVQVPRRCFLATSTGGLVAIGAAPGVALAASAADAATTTNTNSAFSSNILMQCQSGALMPEQAITGAYEQECMKLAVREIPLKGGATLRIQQGAAGAGTTGMAVWNSSLLLSRLLQQVASWSNDWTLLRILELGCGTGLASLTAAALGAQHVIATDGNPDVIQLAQQNIRVARLQDYVQAAVLPWNLLNALDYADEMDLVVGSDLTYQSQNWPVLAETMATIVKPGTGVVIYLTLGHAGFAVQAELQGFLSVAQQYGLTAVNDVGNLGWPTTDLTRVVYEKCLQPEELSIVQSTGGVRVLLLQRKTKR